MEPSPAFSDVHITAIHLSTRTQWEVSQRGAWGDREGERGGSAGWGECSGEGTLASLGLRRLLPALQPSSPSAHLGEDLPSPLDITYAAAGRQDGGFSAEV